MSFAILDGVPKDSKGYDDIDAFWEAADELVGQTKSPIHADDFNYDMTYSVSDDDFEELDDYSSESENEDFDDTAPLSTLKSRSSINSVGKTRESMSYEDLLDSSGDTATVAERSVSRLSSKKSNQSTNKSISNDSIDYAADDDHLDYETTFTPLSAYSARKSNAKSDSSKLNSKSKSKLNDTAETSRRVSFGNSVRFSDISPINNEEAFDDFESNVDVSNIDTPSSRGSIAKSRSISTSSKSSKKSSPATDYDSLMKSPSQSVVSTPGSNEFTRVARYAEDSLYEGSETESEDVDTTLNTTMNSQSANISNDFIHASYLKTISPSNENYMLYKGGDGSDSDESDERASGLRRSRRATKGKKFAFWKGERPIYNMGTLVGLATAPPSERKRKIDHKRPRGVAKMRLLETEEELPEFIPPKDVKFIDRSSADNLRVWQDSEQIVTSMKVVCHAETLLPASALPKSANRPKGKDKVGFAAHSFNVSEVPGVMSGWISGFVDLPPEAIKDAEGVGRFAQVFFVSDCQNGSLELGIADPDKDSWDNKRAQRQLLRKGDSFVIPPGNIYRLENHSIEKSAMLFWTIIKPLELQPDDEDEE